MIPANELPLEVWLAFWRYKRWYHRYTVEGLETLLTDRPMLITGYHGRPAAYDMCILTVQLYEQLGYLPHGMLNASVDDIPALKWLCDCIGYFTNDTSDAERIATAVRRGEHLIITPGAAFEGARSYRDNYRVRWGKHVGYLRLALKYNLPIVPVGAAGADGAFIGLNDGMALSRRFKWMPRGWALWLGLGPLGIYPFSPPFPVKMHQIIGEPIDFRDAGVKPDADRTALLPLHERVTGEVQKLLDRARRRVREHRA